jgi:glucokinase
MPDRFVVGVDLGGTKILALVVDKQFAVVGRAKKSTKAQEGVAHVHDRIVAAVIEACRGAGLDPKALAGVGVGSPGPLDPATGVIIDSPNLGWHNYPLREKLQQALGVPVAVDNDANLGTLSEQRLGAARGKQHVVGIFAGTGIGGGLVLNGQLFYGASGAAGEIGHIVMNPDGPLCGCGNRGCLEAIASRSAIAGEAAVAAVRGHAPHLLAACGGDVTKVRSGDLAEAIQAGDQAIETIVRRAARYIGIAIGSLVNLLSPDCVVLGGGMVEAMEDIFLAEAREALKHHAMPYLAQRVEIMPARLGDDAVALGAALLIAEKR